MSYLSIKTIQNDYIRYYEIRGTTYIIYAHPLFSSEGILITLSDISIDIENSRLKIRVRSDKTRYMIQRIESLIRMSYPRLYPILHEDCIYIPNNHVTSQFAREDIHGGVLVIKHLRETYDKNYRAIIHFHLNNKSLT